MDERILRFKDVCQGRISACPSLVSFPYVNDKLHIIWIFNKSTAGPLIMTLKGLDFQDNEETI